MVMIIFILLLSGCNNLKNEKENLNQKVNSEVSYIDNELISIVSSLNNIYFDKYKLEIQEVPNKSSSSENKTSESDGEPSDKSNKENSSESEKEQDATQKQYSIKSNNLLKSESIIDWNELRSRVENLYNVWPTISVDLKEIGVSEEHLKQFEQNLDNIAISTKQENKQMAIDSLIQTYKSLPEFAKEYNSDEKILQAKYKLLICYNYAEQEQWEQFQNALTDFKMSFSNFTSANSQNKRKENNIKNAKVIINEMNNSSNIRDKEIFFIKYRNLMKELNIISSN